MAVICITSVVALTGCNRDRTIGPHGIQPELVGDPHRGAQLIEYFGCGGCHTIGGIPGAIGLVGPPLSNIGRRIYIAGMLRNRPDNLVRWIQNPQAIVPGNVMPRLGIDKQDARDIAAYLYTRK